MLSVVIPTYNAQKPLRALLSQLEDADDVVVSDGGSSDKTLSVAAQAGTRIALGGSGRGRQLALGARWSLSRGDEDWLLFLHADSRLPDNWRKVVDAHIAHSPSRAAYFRFGLDDKGFWPRIVEFWVSVRCFWLALPYGDQGLLIRRDHYDAVGGYPDFPLFEDVQIVRAIGAQRLMPLSTTLKTSAEKFRRDGYRRRTFSNLSLLIKFLRGADPHDLAKAYT